MNDRIWIRYSRWPERKRGTRIAITIRDIVRLDVRDSPIKAMTVEIPKGELYLVSDSDIHLIEHTQFWLLTGAI